MPTEQDEERSRALAKLSELAIEHAVGSVGDDVLAWHAYDASTSGISINAIGSALGCSHQRAARLIGRGRIVQALEEQGRWSLPT